MDFRDQVKSAADIVQVVGDSVRLKKSGADRWLGLCPFHNEKTPSFTVNSRLQIFKCFGCQKAGDVFTFVMEFQGLSFVEALHLLAERHGIPIPKKRAPEQLDEEARERDALLRMHEIALEFFRERLRSSAGESTREYVKRRGLEAPTIDQFELGYAPPGNSLTGVLRSKGFEPKQLTASGLVGQSEDRGDLYDRFRDRLIFPIADQQGRVIAFGGRALREDQNAKYLNSPETTIYKKSSVLYNLHRAKQSMRKSNRVVLAEGYMDVIGIARSGLEEVVATCGTALTPLQVRGIRRLVERVVVNFDSDDAGRNAAEKAVQMLLPEGATVRVLELPDGQDPDDFAREQGGEAYRAQLDAAPNYYSWLAERARQRYDLSSAEGRVQAFEFLRPSIQAIPDKLHRAAAAGDLADRLGVDADLVRQEFVRGSAARSRAPISVPDAALPASERILFELFIEDGPARAELLAEVVKLEGLSAGGLFRSMQAATADGEEFEYTAFEARLDERDRDIASRVVFARDQTPPTIEQGREALGALRRLSAERRYRAIGREILEAQHAGDNERSLRLITERAALQQELSSNADAAGAPGQ